MEALNKDFLEHGVFIVDTFEKNKNLVYFFLPKSTFLIAGRNHISDVKEDRTQKQFLDLAEVKELTIDKFSIEDIKCYIKKSNLEQPTEKQLSQIEELTNGNALLIYLLITVASEYKSWNEFDYDEMQKVFLEDKDCGLIYYLTKRILTHTQIEDIWKLVVPRDLNIEIEPILFEDKGVFDSLVNVGLAYSGKGKERYSYTLHDDVYNAIEAFAKKELKENSLSSWYDNKEVQNIHQKLKKFYEVNKTDVLNRKFDICYHSMMMKHNFESDFHRDRKAFIESFLGAIFTPYKEKISLCKGFNTFDENFIKQTIEKIEEEVQNALSRMSIELYQECSAYVSKGISEEGVYTVTFLEPLLGKYKKQQDLFQIYFFLGQTYQHKEEYEKTRKVYIEAISKDIDDEDFFYLLIGNTYVYEEKYEKALEYYKLASRINPNSDTVFNNMGGYLL